MRQVALDRPQQHPRRLVERDNRIYRHAPCRRILLARRGARQAEALRPLAALRQVSATVAAVAYDQHRRRLYQLVGHTHALLLHTQDCRRHARRGLGRRLRHRAVQHGSGNRQRQAALHGGVCLRGLAGGRGGAAPRRHHLGLRRPAGRPQQLRGAVCRAARLLARVDVDNRPAHRHLP